MSGKTKDWPVPSKVAWKLGFLPGAGRIPPGTGLLMLLAGVKLLLVEAVYGVLKVLVGWLFGAAAHPISVGIQNMP